MEVAFMYNPINAQEFALAVGSSHRFEASNEEIAKQSLELYRTAFDTANTFNKSFTKNKSSKESHGSVNSFNP